ncbi:MAG: peptide chain release factor N(5)-glutamine methyltransferase [Chlamydiales bacterium]
MITVREALSFLIEALQSAQINQYRRQAENLLCDLLDCSRGELFAIPDKLLTSEQWSGCRERLLLRLQGVPLPYIRGQVEFYGCTIQVNPAVLIPRQETEILVDKIVQDLIQDDLKGKSLWDLCCGSGCIGIALKKRFPDLQVTLSDRSSEAAVVARENARNNQAEVEVLEGDFLLPFDGRKVHYFVCNPPYISEVEFASLDWEVRGYEPSMALLGGETGFEFYERLVKELPNYLYPGARVWLEIGYQQGAALLQLFTGPDWTEIKVEKDWAGHDRFFSCLSHFP